VTTHAPELLRLFVAIELPGDVLRELNDIQHGMQRDPALARLRWVRPEGIHLTLKFLGETPATKQAAIEQAMVRGVDGISSFTLHLGRLGKFGGRTSPRVVWVDVEGDVETLQRLQAAVEHELGTGGFPAESRSFSPHLTLARIPPEQAREVAGPLARAIETADPRGTDMRVEAVSLIKSDLRPTGAVYTRLFDAPLR
jgi:2'-5' RNA ligase